MRDEGICRRGFLARSTGAWLAARAAQEPGGEARGSGADRLGWFLAMHSYTLRHVPFLDAVDLTARLRVRHVVGWSGHLVSEDYPDIKLDFNEPRVHKLVQPKFQEKRMFVPGYGPVAIPAAEEAAKTLLENCRKMGIMTVITESPPGETTDRLCRDMGMYVALRPSAATADPGKLMEACTGRSRHVGICADTGFWKRRGLDPVDSLRRLKGRLLIVIPKDLSEDGQETAWGDGKSDLKGQLAELKSQGFKGFVALEHETPEGEEAVKAARRSADFFRLACDELSPPS